jgi:hypothetical protein
MAQSPKHRLAPALACAVVLLAGPERVRAEDPGDLTDPPTLTSQDFLDQLDVGAALPQAPAPALPSATALDARALLARPTFAPPVNGEGAALQPGFWYLRTSLAPGWDSKGENARQTYFLQGRAFDVAYGVRFDKRERFDAMASWGYLSLGAGKTKEGFTGFGGIMLPLDDRHTTVRLGAEVGKKGPRMMLGLDLQLGGRD